MVVVFVCFRDRNYINFSTEYVLEDTLMFNYVDYLHSEQWKRIAKKRLEIDKYHCQFCGSSGTQRNPLEIHHLNYRNLGRENVYVDLLTLCHSCHGGIHRMMNRVISPQGQQGFSNTAIPTTSVYTIAGQELSYRKENLNNDKENNQRTIG